MHQIKIFKGIESELHSVEQEVNSWLAAAKVKVLQIVGNLSPQSSPVKEGAVGLTKSQFAPSDALIIVLYETH